jgi:hypothetical protein
METIFVSYHEWAFYSPTPTLQNFGSMVEKPTSAGKPSDC